MSSVKGTYDGKTITLLEPIPRHKKGSIMITIIDDSHKAQSELIKKYVSYYKTLSPEEEAENSLLEEDFFCADTEEILKGQDK